MSQETRNRLFQEAIDSLKKRIDQLESRVKYLEDKNSVYDIFGSGLIGQPSTEIGQAFGIQPAERGRGE